MVDGRLKVAVRDLGPGRGRGLQAVADADAGEVLLSVPLTRVFSSEVRCGRLGGHDTRGAFGKQLGGGLQGPGAR